MRHIICCGDCIELVREDVGKVGLLELDVFLRGEGGDDDCDEFESNSIKSLFEST